MKRILLVVLVVLSLVVGRWYATQADDESIFDYAYILAWILFILAVNVSCRGAKCHQPKPPIGSML